MILKNHIYIYMYVCVSCSFTSTYTLDDDLRWPDPGELQHFGAQSVSNSLWTLATMRWRLGGLGSLSELLGSIMGTIYSYYR